MNNGRDNVFFYGNSNPELAKTVAVVSILRSVNQMSNDLVMVKQLSVCTRIYAMQMCICSNLQASQRTTI